eukprot:GSA120T00003970001.1
MSSSSPSSSDREAEEEMPRQSSVAGVDDHDGADGGESIRGSEDKRAPYCSPSTSSLPGHENLKTQVIDDTPPPPAARGANSPSPSCHDVVERTSATGVPDAQPFAGGSCIVMLEQQQCQDQDSCGFRVDCATRQPAYVNVEEERSAAKVAIRVECSSLLSQHESEVDDVGSRCEADAAAARSSSYSSSSEETSDQDDPPGRDCSLEGGKKGDALLCSSRDIQIAFEQGRFEEAFLEQNAGDPATSSPENGADHLMLERSGNGEVSSSSSSEDDDVPASPGCTSGRNKHSDRWPRNAQQKLDRLIRYLIKKSARSIVNGMLALSALCGDDEFKALKERYGNPRAGISALLKDCADKYELTLDSSNQTYICLVEDAQASNTCTGRSRPIEKTVAKNLNSQAGAGIVGASHEDREASANHAPQLAPMSHSEDQFQDPAVQGAIILEPAADDAPTAQTTGIANAEQAASASALLASPVSVATAICGATFSSFSPE